jgi:hypothetical protein
LGAIERKLKDLESASDGQSPDCWPAWRVLLRKVNNPKAFEQWWTAHGKACPTCRATHGRVVRDLAADEARDPALQTVRFLFDPACAEASPYAAATPVCPEAPSAPLPLVQFHSLKQLPDTSLDAVWGVTWGNTLFILLAGTEGVLADWRQGAALLDSQGATIGELKPATTTDAQCLAPGGRIEGLPVLCFQCQLPVGHLAADPFAIPRLLEGGVRLVPVGAEPSPMQELIADLTSRNRIRRFLASLPAHVSDSGEALTLSFYLRVLLGQRRLTREDKASLKGLEWLPPDLADALATPGGEDE